MAFSRHGYVGMCPRQVRLATLHIEKEGLCGLEELGLPSRPPQRCSVA
ncbi:hypothetical protein [Kibdelosporangium philippinense]